MRATALLLALWWCAALSRAAALSRRTRKGKHVSEDSRGLRGDLATNSSGDAPSLHVKADTVVYMPTSKITGVKLRILMELARVSPYPIVVGYDDKAPGEISSGIRSELHSALKDSRGGAMVMKINRERLFSKYNASKVANYAGVYKDNPAKLAVMDWFDSSRYDFLWHLEDDTWARGLDMVASKWESSRVDLIIKNASQLPFWACGNSTWRIGDRSKLPHDDVDHFVHVNPAAFRMSKQFARSLLQEIQESDTTNHHEVWFPYIVQKYNLSWKPLTHTANLNFNVHSESQMLFNTNCIADLEANESKWLVHPVKCFRA